MSLVLFFGFCFGVILVGSVMTFLTVRHHMAKAKLAKQTALVKNN